MAAGIVPLLVGLLRSDRPYLQKVVCIVSHFASEPQQNRDVNIAACATATYLMELRQGLGGIASNTGFEEPCTRFLRRRHCSRRCDSAYSQAEVRQVQHASGSSWHFAVSLTRLPATQGCHCCSRRYASARFHAEVKRLQYERGSSSHFVESSKGLAADQGCNRDSRRCASACSHVDVSVSASEKGNSFSFGLVGTCVVATLPHNA